MKKRSPTRMPSDETRQKRRKECVVPNTKQAWKNKTNCTVKQKKPQKNGQN
jgi:hypothetical protein